VIDFIVRLKSELAIIINKSSSADLDEIEKIAKNMESTSLINKNILVAITILAVIEIKELKAQILELKSELKDSKYVFREDHKLLSNNRENKKLLYKGSNYKPVNKRNLECYKCSKKGHFKSKC